MSFSFKFSQIHHYLIFGTLFNITFQPSWATFSALNMPHAFSSLGSRFMYWNPTHPLNFSLKGTSSLKFLWSLGWNELCLLWTALQLACTCVRWKLLQPFVIVICVHMLSFSWILNLCFL